MKNEFVPYEIALAMKELGFDESNRWLYHDGKLVHTYNFKPRNHNAIPGTIEVTAPLYQQAFRWFREEFEIDVCIIPKFGDNGYGAECFKNGSLLPIELLDKYSYQEAQDTCLRKLIEIVKD